MTMGSTGKYAAARKPLTRDIEEALVNAIAPIRPTRARAAAMRTRLLDRVRRERQQLVTVRAAEGAWVTLAPKIAMKMLNDDGVMQVFLLRLERGARIPAHEHPGEELCLVLEGSVRLGDVEVSAGDLHVAPARTAHGDVYSSTGALLFMRTASGAVSHHPAR